jgi:hypothetical protein
LLGIFLYNLLIFLDYYIPINKPFRGPSLDGGIISIIVVVGFFYSRKLLNNEIWPGFPGGAFLELYFIYKVRQPFI